MTMPNIQTPIKFVNREEQIEDFRMALDRIRTLGSIFQTLYEWYGSPGIGKSTLTRLLMAVCERCDAPFSFIDFHIKRNPHTNEYTKDISVLIEDLNRRFNHLESEDVHAAIAQYRNAQGNERSAKQANLSKVFQRHIYQLIDDKKAVVLFFDETEQADQEIVVPWLEEWLINPLIQDGRCIIVWTGRRPQRWKRFEVRRRTRVQELGVFDEKSTQELFKINSSYSLTDFAIPVRKLTGGHPYADTIVLRYLDSMAKKGKPLSQQQPDQLESGLLDILIHDFIDSFAFKGLEPEIAHACRVMSLVRQFDVIMLREILSETTPKMFGHYGRNEFGGLLSRLRTTQLVIWDDRRKGYAIDPTLRHILGEYIRRKQPRLYEQANEVSIRVYQDWIARAGDNRGIYIVEELYQQACLNQLSGETKNRRNLPDLLQQRIDEYHQPDVDLRDSALNRLYHELENDPDLPRLTEDREKLLRLVRKIGM
jgi:hypothetical protein